MEFPARGLIYDRNGKLLVYNEVTYDLMVNLKNVKKDFDTTELCNLVHINKDISEQEWKKQGIILLMFPSIIEHEISKETYGFIQEKLINYPGFFVQARTVRRYPLS